MRWTTELFPDVSLRDTARRRAIAVAIARPVAAVAELGSLGGFVRA